MMLGISPEPVHTKHEFCHWAPHSGPQSPDQQWVISAKKDNKGTIKLENLQTPPKAWPSPYENYDYCKIKWSVLVLLKKDKQLLLGLFFDLHDVCAWIHWVSILAPSNSFPSL
jgi:hypothetical protein